MKKIYGWRTFIGTLTVIAALLFGLWMLPPEKRHEAFFAFSGGVVGALAMLAGKSAVGNLAAGAGVQGAVATLMTDRKPGDLP